MPAGRNFSYETNDEYQLSSRPQNHDAYQPYSQQPYFDAPSRDIISPPPQYTSPPPPEPVSPVHHRGFSQDRHLERRPGGGYSDYSPPLPPPHQSPPRGPRIDTNQAYRPTSIVTPDMDNFSDQAHGGGIGAVAQGVADQNERESGLEALRAMQQPAASRHYHSNDRDPYGQRPLPHNDRDSYSSGRALAAGAATPGTMTPDPYPAGYSSQSIPLDDYPSHQMPYGGYHDSPYQNSSGYFNPALDGASINPNNILDDGDDGFMREPHRRSMLDLGRNRSNEPMGPGDAAPAGGATGGLLGGVFGKKGHKRPTSSYNPFTAGVDGSDRGRGEKSEWLSRQKKGNNKMRWTVGVVIGLVIIIAIAAGIVGGVLGTRKSGDGGGSGGNGPVPGSTNNAQTDTQENGDLGKDSGEIKALMNNKDLHKVFPAMDYTPWGTQYPLCLTYPPSQNNVTRDMAVLSQLTNTVRLYGTDCNQTEMVLHAIDRLELADTKVWMGVWIDTNQTTTDRQIDQMYKILDNVKDHSIFKGVIIGNEALYRAGVDKSQSEQELIDILTTARTKFQQKSYNLPIATSDLGDNWNTQLVQVSDFVMSNIHPFFAGVNVKQAAGWTWDFWHTHDVPLTAANDEKQIISETGWPSGGGTDCGGTDGSCAPGQPGAVASVDNMNAFMDDWVCQAMQNGTEYFWFEAFDEPWKESFNQGDQNWEDKWGLMTPDRKLKDGLKIPDCDGTQITANT